MPRATTETVGRTPVDVPRHSETRVTMTTGELAACAPDDEAVPVISRCGDEALGVCPP